LLKASRGYVLLSEYENWCLSAHEAAACGLPLLVPNQKWSRERFGEAAEYFSHSNPRDNIALLRSFYKSCLSLPAPKVQLFSWTEVAHRLKTLYEAVLRTSR
jgi:glycosyltransferase involved in cell wall biosynthesis